MSDEAGRTIEAERVVVRSAGGRERIEIGALGDRFFGVGLYDESGALRAAFRCRPEGESGVYMWQREDELPRAHLASTGGGRPSLAMLDDEGHQRLGLSLRKDGRGYVTLFGRRGAHACFAELARGRNYDPDELSAKPKASLLVMMWLVERWHRRQMAINVALAITAIGAILLTVLT